MEKSQNPRLKCAVDAVMSLIEGRWKTTILCKLAKGDLRFNQLMKELDGVSPRILSIQLKDMEADGLIIRTVYPEVPMKVVYSVSEKGRSLFPILMSMAEWALENMYPNMVTFDESTAFPDVGREIASPSQS